MGPSEFTRPGATMLFLVRNTSRHTAKRRPFLFSQLE